MFIVNKGKMKHLLLRSILFVGLLFMHSVLLLANGGAYSTWFRKDGISYYINVLSLSNGGLATVKGIDCDVVRASIPAEIDFAKPTPAKTLKLMVK